MKSPWVKLFTDNFIASTNLMSPVDVGHYIRILCYMHKEDALSHEQMDTICGGTTPRSILEKLHKNNNGLYYSERMKYEKEKSTRYSESRRKNRVGGHKRKGGVQTTTKPVKSKPEAPSEVSGGNLNDDLMDFDPTTVQKTNITSQVRAWAMELHSLWPNRNSYKMSQNVPEALQELINEKGPEEYKRVLFGVRMESRNFYKGNEIPGGLADFLKSKRYLRYKLQTREYDG